MMPNYRENANGVLEYQDMFGTWNALRNSNNKIYRSVDPTEMLTGTAMGLNLLSIGNLLNNVCAQFGLPSTPIISVAMGMYTELQKGISQQLNMPLPQAQELLLKTVKSPLFWDAKEKDLIDFAINAISDYNKAPFPQNNNQQQQAQSPIDMSALLATITSAVKSEVNSAIDSRLAVVNKDSTPEAAQKSKLIV